MAFDPKTHFPRKEGHGQIGLSVPELQAEISRLTAERDEARAALAAAPAIWLGKAADRVAELCCDTPINFDGTTIYGGRPLLPGIGAAEIRALIPTDATEALRKIRADAVRDVVRLVQTALGMQEAGYPTGHDLVEQLNSLADRIEKGEA